MNTWNTEQWIGGTMLVLGLACLWCGGRLGRLLPKPWSAPPRDWLPEYRRIVRFALTTMVLGIVLVLAGLACVIWGRQA